jgi:hypothetical protein
LTPTIDTEVADLTEATFTSYAAASITWGTAYVNSNNQIELDGSLITWVAGSSPTAEVVRGVYVTDSGGTHLLYVDSFSSVVSISVQGDGVSFVPALVLSLSVGVPRVGVTGPIFGTP